MIEQWVPEPLVDTVPDNHPALKEKLITGSVDKRIVVNGHDCLNMASHNYLALLSDKGIQDSAIATVQKYGVGSCGPRGFYGTIGKKFCLFLMTVFILLVSVENITSRFLLLYLFIYPPRRPFGTRRAYC